ncbi:PspC domain-containing protein [Luedemannella helvata]|uniref:Phage shock protein C (PspC) family protein n=1 Tax=Luedemannella helvata TaxID=349315 RepID=A0ABP4VWM5_9ACTN
MTDDRPPQPPGNPDAPEPATAGGDDTGQAPPPPPGGDHTGQAPPPPGAGQYGAQPSSPLYTFAVKHGLVRPAQGRVFAGVCSAFGRATNTDPVLWRIVLAVLTIFGGVGLLVYLVGWLTLPSEGDTGAPVEAVLGRGKSSTPTVVTVIVACIVLLTLAAFLGGRAEPGLFAVLLLLGGGYLLLRERGGAAGGAPGAPPPVPPAAGYPPAPGYPVVPPPAGYYPPPSQGATMSSPATATTPLAPPPPGAAPRPPFAPHGPYAPPPVPPTFARPVPTPPPPKPPKSRLGGLVLSLMLIVLGIVALVDLGGASVPGEVYVGAALATVGFGLVLGAWVGRARGLIGLGIALSLLLALTAGVNGVRHDGNWGHMGNIEWRPQTVAEIQDQYRQGAGDTRLDLSKVDFTDRDVTTRLTTRAGNVDVILPRNVDATVEAKVVAGNAEVFGEKWEGLFNPSRTVTDLGVDGAGGGKITLIIEVTAGNLEVHR